MTVDASHFTVTGCLPVLVIRLHDMTGQTGLGLIREAVSDDIGANISCDYDDAKSYQSAFAAPYKLTNPHVQPLALSGVSRIQRDVRRSSLLLS